MTHLPLPPDPMPLREVLRGLRHGLRRSRRALRESLPPGALPGPAGLLARPVLDGLDALAGEVDAAGTGLARRLLGVGPRPVPPPGALLSGRDGPRVAGAVYAALRGALRRMGDGDAFVSEAAARRALVAAARGGPRPPAAVAADLALALVAGGAVRDVAPSPGLRVPAGRVAPVAAAAAMLWLLSGPEGDEEGAALDAATDLAVALAAEVGAAVAAGDRAGLARLLDEFAAHV